MTIEIESPRDAVDASLTRMMCGRISEMHNRLPGISGARISFREDATPFDRNHFICEIAVDIFGSSFAVSRKGLSYELAAGEALTFADEKVDELMKREHEPPDTQTSTVKV